MPGVSLALCSLKSLHARASSAGTCTWLEGMKQVQIMGGMKTYIMSSPPRVYRVQRWHHRMLATRAVRTVQDFVVEHREVQSETKMDRVCVGRSSVTAPATSEVPSD